MEYYKNLDLEDIKYFCEFDLVWKTEQWKDIVGYEGLYKASDLGRIKSLKRYVNSKSGLRIVNERLISITLSKTGYPRIILHNLGKRKYVSVHRLVAISFLYNPENKLQVNHINGIKTDNRVENLEWCTSSENVIHSWKIGLSKNLLGENARFVKLTNEQVLFIRNSNKKNSELAKMFNVHYMTIINIINRTSWKHI